MPGYSDPDPALRIGQVDSFRWRGARQSAPLLALAEACLADCAGLLRRIRSLQSRPTYLVGVVPSVVSLDGNTSDLRTLLPKVWEVNGTRIQSLRAQLDFKVRNPFNS